MDGPTAAAFGRGINRSTLYISNGSFPFYPNFGNPGVSKVELDVDGYLFQQGSSAAIARCTTEPPPGQPASHTRGLRGQTREPRSCPVHTPRYHLLGVEVPCR